MGARRKIFHNGFAGASPVFTVRPFHTSASQCAVKNLPRILHLLGLLLLCGVPSFAGEGAGTANTTVRRQAASGQFARAEEQRAALNEKAPNKRSLAEYKQVVSTYHRVYLITPHAAEVPESLVAVAELYVEMGERFGRNYYQSAVETYQFLIHEYPTSKLGADAMLKVAEIEKDPLGDSRAASKIYDEFLKKYPRSPRRREVLEARAELALVLNAEGATVAKSVPAAEAATPDMRAGKRDEPIELARSASDEAPLPPASPSGGAPRVRRITTKATAESTRVIIDLEDTVQYSSARIRNPDRIFFDIHSARLTPEVAKAGVRVEGELLTAVRAAQNHAGIVRVVLDVNGVKDYTATLQDNPPELIIDLYPNSGFTRTAKAKSSAVPSDGCRTRAAGRDKQESCAPTSELAQPVLSGSSPQVAQDGVVDVASVSASERRTAATAAVEPKPVLAKEPASLPPSLVRGGAAGGSRSKSAKNMGTKPDLIQPSAVPAPTRDGQATLTRALGLKIGRIVIDAGHGGHDTGTIGPTGLMEKDLCLDVALRLGKIIQQRLPGAEVVYTRTDDSFIPLEERTHIANEAKADLFISIHANSSHDHGARGIETYYLNLKASPDAMEVASRENATAQQSVHDLEDLVKKIARSEKIDESREFAADIQDSLAKRIQKSYKPVKDRGVRKAPFVVLIGADMPSILTEISFLSNPADEQLLKKPEHRQKVAEGLYQGVASYLQSLNSMTGIVPKLPLTPAGRSVAAASVDQTRNQR
jgi:N-acetylmuramoyl-L-alanine amidase